MPEFPHIMLGKNGITLNRSNKEIPQNKPKYKPLPSDNIGLMQSKSTNWNPDTVLKWAMYIMILIVVGYALIRIINSIFFGG